MRNVGGHKLGNNNSANVKLIPGRQMVLGTEYAAFPPGRTVPTSVHSHSSITGHMRDGPPKHKQVTSIQWPSTPVYPQVIDVFHSSVPNGRLPQIPIHPQRCIHDH